MNSLSFMHSTHISPRRPPHSLPRGVTATHRPSPDSHRPTQAQQIPPHSCARRILPPHPLPSAIRDSDPPPPPRPLHHPPPSPRSRSPRLDTADAYPH